MKLTKKDLRAWVRALRSGKYKKTTNRLCRDKGDEYTYDMRFCCLGVACDLFLDGYWDRGSGSGASVRFVKSGQSHYAGTADMPPEPLRSALNEALGDDGSDPSSTSPCARLASLNDHGRSFNYIADRIEKLAKL